MKYPSIDRLVMRILAAASVAAAAPALAQQAPPAAPVATADVVGANDSLDEIVVTASSGDKTKLRSSLQVTDIPSELVENMAPRDTAEMLRLIPGLSVQDQAGSGGNANFTVRGLPVTTGGAPFVQIQEDGLPQVLFGDMNFGNNDYWTRFDVSNTIEATVGGNSATLAAGAPGAVINFISDTGTHQGGVVTLSEGIGFNETKATFAFGGPLSDTWRYHVDGFYTYGTGPRDQGFIGENGYQVKANLTHDLPDDKGYIRFYAKILNDQEEYNAGGPVLATGSGNTLTSLSPFPGFDVRTGTTVGIYNEKITYLNNDSGQFSQVPNNGIHPVANSLGAELHLTPLADDLAVDDKFRITSMHGDFAAQFFGLGTTASVIGSTVNGLKVGSIVYANGPYAGQAYTSPFLNNSTQIYTNMSDMGSVVNDLGLSDKFQTSFGKLSGKVGLFYMSQTIDQNWHPNAQTQALNGSNPASLNLISTAGQLLSSNGVNGYNSAWGTSVDRTYAMNVADTAPYLDLTWDLAGLQLEGSIREDDYHVTGWAESASAATTLNGYLTGSSFSPTGALTTPYVAYSTLDPSTYEPLDYSIVTHSWSAGALYQLDNDTSVYVRASRGAKANTDRNILSGYTNPNGSLNVSGQNNAVDIVLQQEAGVKRKGILFGGSYGVTATYFHTSFGESSFDLTKPASQRFFDEQYSAQGVEVEGTYSLAGFALVAQFTLQDPKVDANSIGSSPATLVSSGTGFLPGGMAKLSYAITPSYKWQGLTGGVVIQGQSQENINGATPFYSPGQTFYDLFGIYEVGGGFSVGLHVNNLLNTLGVGGGGSVTTGPGTTGVSAEPGRTILADVSFKF